MYNRDKIINVMQEIYNESKVISPYVVIAQPRRIEGEIPAQNFNGYEGLHCDFSGFSHGFCDVYGEKVDVARNYLIEQALESGAKYLFFIGEDTVVPFDAFIKLHKTIEENPNSIVTGVYYIKLSNAMIMVKDGNWINIPNVDPGQLIEAWQTGMDCMLIPIDILRKLKDQDPEIPFCCIGNNIGGIPFIGEDNFFVHRIHKMGVKLLVNTDVQCLHVDLASGKYTAHPDVDLRNYYTNIKITKPLSLEDKEYIDRRWIDRLPEGSNSILNKIKELQENEVPVKFNMGCGRDNFEGYINIDKYNQNAEYRQDLLNLNLPENCADEIYASHVIEHIPYFQVEIILKSWLSILKPGAKLILELPDLEKLCEDFINNTNDQDRFMTTLCIYGSEANCVNPEQLKENKASPHVWGYYPKVLSIILESVGYENICVLPAQGKHPGKNFRVESTKRV